MVATSFGLTHPATVNRLTRIGTIADFTAGRFMALKSRLINLTKKLPADGGGLSLI
jgi:hypothetical protein